MAVAANKRQSKFTNDCSNKYDGKIVKIALKKQNGHVAVEWTLITVVIVFALFSPIPGTDESVVQLFIGAVRDFYANMTFLLSLP